MNKVHGNIALPNAFTFQVNSARWLQEAKLNIEIFLCWNSLAVQQMFQGFYTEISTMSFFSSTYYAQFMLEAKYAARAPRNLLTAIQRTSELAVLLPEVARAALTQRGRHLCYLCPEQAFFSFFDDDVNPDEKRRMADTLMTYIDQWSPGEILIDIVSQTI